MTRSNATVNQNKAQFKAEVQAANAAVPTDVTKGYVKRWTQFVQDRSTQDYEIAGLLHEIRQHFPRDASGSHQFRVWCCANLRVARAGRALTCLEDKARAFLLFPEQKQWEMVQGWQTMSFLVGLQAAQRRLVWRKVTEEIKRRDVEHVSLQTVRNVAFRLHIVTRRPGTNTMSAIGHVSVLRNWINKLYSENPNLPPMPTDVLNAFRTTRMVNPGRAGAKPRSLQHV